MTARVRHSDIPFMVFSGAQHSTVSSLLQTATLSAETVSFIGFSGTTDICHWMDSLPVLVGRQDSLGLYLMGQDSYMDKHDLK